MKYIGHYPFSSSLLCDSILWYLQKNFSATKYALILPQNCHPKQLYKYMFRVSNIFMLTLNICITNTACFKLPVMFQVIKLDLHNLQPNKITVWRREVFLKAHSYPRNRWYLKTAEKERVSFIYGCGHWKIAPVPVKDHIPKSDTNNTYHALAHESHTLLSTSIITHKFH